ncbi:hypothetical protein MT418_004308 [Batrachochytrium dendrobatidis]
MPILQPSTLDNSGSECLVLPNIPTTSDTTMDHPVTSESTAGTTAGCTITRVGSFGMNGINMKTKHELHIPVTENNLTAGTPGGGPYSCDVTSTSAVQLESRTNTLLSSTSNTHPIICEPHIMNSAQHHSPCVSPLQKQSLSASLQPDSAQTVSSPISAIKTVDNKMDSTRHPQHCASQNTNHQPVPSDPACHSTTSNIDEAVSGNDSISDKTGSISIDHGDNNNPSSSMITACVPDDGSVDIDISLLRASLTQQTAGSVLSPEKMQQALQTHSPTVNNSMLEEQYQFLPTQNPPCHIDYTSYVLKIRQQPKQARCSSMSEKGADKRPLDPLPILQLTLNDPHSQDSKAYLHNPFFFVYATLLGTDISKDTYDYKEIGNRVMSGSTASSLHRLRDLDSSYGGFFVFPDISIRQEGKFRIKFTLFEILSAGADPLVPPKVARRNSVISDVFTVYQAKLFPGMVESSPLSRFFAEQGLKIRIRKDVSRKSLKRGLDGLDSDEDPKKEVPSQLKRTSHEHTYDDRRDGSHSTNGVRYVDYPPSHGGPNGLNPHNYRRPSESNDPYGYGAPPSHAVYDSWGRPVPTNYYYRPLAYGDAPPPMYSSSSQGPPPHHMRYSYGGPPGPYGGHAQHPMHSHPPAHGYISPSSAPTYSPYSGNYHPPHSNHAGSTRPPPSMLINSSLESTDRHPSNGSGNPNHSYGRPYPYGPSMQQHAMRPPNPGESAETLANAPLTKTEPGASQVSPKFESKAPVTEHHYVSPSGGSSDHQLQQMGHSYGGQPRGQRPPHGPMNHSRPIPINRQLAHPDPYASLMPSGASYGHPSQHSLSHSHQHPSQHSYPQRPLRGPIVQGSNEMPLKQERWNGNMPHSATGSPPDDRNTSAYSQHAYHPRSQDTGACVNMEPRSSMTSVASSYPPQHHSGSGSHGRALPPMQTGGAPTSYGSPPINASRNGLAPRSDHQQSPAVSEMIPDGGRPGLERYYS